MNLSKIITALQLFPEFLTDALRFMLWSHHSPFADKDKRLYYKIIITAHTIEKGLSLKSPRELFGREKMMELCRMLTSYPASAPAFPRMMALGAIATYINFHDQKGVRDPYLDDLRKLLEKENPESLLQHGGVKSIAGIQEGITGHTLSYKDFLSSRYSARAYKQQKLPWDVVESIISTAASSPSQCNRQSTRIHCYQDRAHIAELLALQGGTRGYSEQVPNLFLVTYDITGWGGPYQRNQGYIDAGIASMGILLSCHAHSVASCALNLAFSNKREKQLRALADLPQNERVVMMIAFGYPEPEHHVAARSRRIANESLLVKH
jgi:nitroreductase